MVLRFKLLIGRWANTMRGKLQVPTQAPFFLSGSVCKLRYCRKASLWRAPCFIFLNQPPFSFYHWIIQQHKLYKYSFRFTWQMFIELLLCAEYWAEKPLRSNKGEIRQHLGHKKPCIILGKKRADYFHIPQCPWRACQSHCPPIATLPQGQIRDKHPLERITTRK